MTQQQSKSRYHGIVLVGCVVLSVFALVYAVLALAFIEDALFGTRTVEDACRHIGVHGFLEWVADKTLWFLQH